MKINRLASAILRQTWLLDPRIADGLIPRAVGFLNGVQPNAFDVLSDQVEPITPECWTQDGQVLKGFSDAPKNSIAVIPIQGTIMKDDWCGEAGTSTLSKWTKEAEANENIVGILFYINSGGGSVEGTGEFAQVIKNCFKPTIAWCDGLMASAAYWLGSSCDKIMLSFSTVEVGSIGTAITFYDNREYLAQIGYKQVYINADASKDKNQEYFKALDGDYKPIKTNVLNPTNDEFLSAVRENRAGKLVEFGEGEYKEPLTGNVYVAKKAIEIGLADAIGDFDMAIEELYQMAQSNENSNKKSNMLGNKFKKISALAGKKAEDITEEEVTAANTELTEQGVTGASLVSNTVIEQANANADQLEAAQASVTNITAERDQLKTANETLTADLKKSQAEVTRLGKLGGSKPTSAAPENETIDEDPAGTSEDPFYSEADAEMAKIKAAHVAPVKAK